MIERVEFFLGLGQDTKCRQWLEKFLPSSVHLHQAPNYLAAETDAKRIEHGVVWVKEGITSAPNEYVLCAESQASPAVIATLDKGLIPPPKSVILLMPLGCNYTSLGDSPIQRYKELLKRSRRFWSHKNQSLRIWGNRTTAINVAFDSVRYLSKLEEAYTFGANQNITNTLSRIALTIPVTIYAANDDSLFPFHEIEREFRGTKVEVKMIEGTHLNRATPLGVEQLKTILN